MQDKSVLFKSPEFHFAIQYAQSPIPHPLSPIEFRWNSNTIFDGVWSTSILLNGKPVPTRGSWTSVCEVSEPTHKYLELESRLGDGLRIQRHFFLDHAEKLLILADSILPTAHEFAKRERKKRNEKKRTATLSQIQYEMRIPLGPNVLGGSGEPNGTDRTISVKTTKSRKKPIARAFPLVLPQWNNETKTKTQAQTQKPSGELEFETEDDNSTMVLRYHGIGDAVFVPIFFDLSESRLRHPYLWKQLTVGEKLEKVPLDRAAGYRIQTHENQYVLYRSLTPQRNRTLLGVNLVSDLFFASFDPEKGTEMILELNEE